jgi:hypothetical protein
MMETASEFLKNKGFKKAGQPFERYNVTISEMVQFLEEYSDQVLKDFKTLTERSEKSTIKLYPSKDYTD